MKFLHTMAAIGFTGGLGSLLVLQATLPDPSELESFAALRMAQDAVSQWILFPSMGLVLISGLLAMAITPSFQDRAWVWAKLATGILVFEGTLAYIDAPMDRAATRARMALSGEFPVADLGATLRPEWTSFWVMMGIGVVNVILGVWRPRFFRSLSAPRPASSAVEPTESESSAVELALPEPDPS